MTKFSNREGIQAVNAENRTVEALQGNYVDNGLEVTTDGTDMVLDVASGTVVHGNEEFEIGATTVTVPDNTEAEPRKDIVYVDDTQSVSIATGASESPQPSLEDVDSVFHTAQPSPPSLVNEEDVVILAEVFVEDGATEIVDDHLQDRRLTLGLEKSEADTFTANWSLVDLPDLEEQYGHAPINIDGEKTVEVYEVNVGNDNGETPEGLKIQLFDIEGDGQDFENRDEFVELELNENYNKGEPITSAIIENKTVVFTLVNDSGGSEFAGGFVKVRISG